MYICVIPDYMGLTMLLLFVIDLVDGGRLN